MPAVVLEPDKVTCASLIRLRQELLRKFGGAPNSVNPFIGLAAYPPDLCGRQCANEALPYGEYRELLTAMSMLEPKMYRLGLQAHEHIFSLETMRFIADNYWSRSAADYCKAVVEKRCGPGDTVILMGAGLLKHGQIGCSAVTVLPYDINCMLPDITEVVDNSQALRGVQLGSTSFIIAADTYGTIADMRFIVRRDCATH